MGKKSKKESRFELVKPDDNDLKGSGLSQKIANIDVLSDFINVRRVKKITMNICESKVPQFEKHMAKFFIKHGYKANIED